MFRKAKCRPIEAIEARNMKSIHVSVTIIKLHFFFLFFLKNKETKEHQHLKGTILMLYSSLTVCTEQEKKETKNKTRTHFPFLLHLNVQSWIRYVRYLVWIVTHTCLHNCYTGFLRQFAQSRLLSQIIFILKLREWTCTVNYFF